MRSLLVYLILVPIFGIIDLTYLGVVMKDFYSHELGDLARRQGAGMAPRWGAAVLVYLLIPAGLMLFVRPLLTVQVLGAPATTWQALVHGTIFGLVSYGIYDLTNMAVLEKWTWRLTLADMAWGGVLCGVSAAIMLQIDRRWLS